MTRPSEKCFSRPLLSGTVFLLMLASTCTSLLLAQNVVLTGALSGRVIDQSGAVIAGATVVAESLGTGAKVSARTNRAGIYRFQAVNPGSYTVLASGTGFREVETLVRVLVGSTTTEDLKLQVGTSSDTIKVAAASLLRPAESSASTVLEQPFIGDLPLNGRRYTDFSVLTPNTSFDGDTGLVSIAGQQGGEDSGYANGNGSNAFTVDGTNATSNYFADILGRYRIPYLYGEDAIQEFQVSVNPYSAIYGGGASFVNAVTRSGGNHFHGSAFYYNRNSATGANDALDKAQGLPKPLDALQQFGAGVGGPILRNRLWFFFDYEQQLRNNPVPVINPALQPTGTNLPTLLGLLGLPANAVLPSPNGPLPIPGPDTAPDPNDPVYLQQAANVLNALSSNLGTAPRKRNDLVFTPRIDYRAHNGDDLFLSLNFNHFSSPGGVITDPTVGSYGTQTLANAYVHTFVAALGYTHTLSPNMVNEFHAGTSTDNQISTPTSAAGNTPTIILDGPAEFTLGNAPFSVGRVFERQYSASDRVDYIAGKHTLQFGFDYSYAYDSDRDDGGADPNADVQFGSFLGSYEFPNLQDFALGQYITYSQSSGNPTYSFSVPYYGFYVQDAYRVLPNLTLDLGVRQDFQVYPQPAQNSLFPLTGQFPNRYLRIAPRLGFAYQPDPHTVVRGGFGIFHTSFNGLNYRNSVVSNGLASQQSSISSSYDGGDPSQQAPTFPFILPSDSPLFQASPDISLVSPLFHSPYIMQGSLQIEREIVDENTTISIGTIWNHGVHTIAGSAYDLNLNRPQGTTTYTVCPANTTVTPCAGSTYTGPTLDSGLLSDGALTSSLGQINALISPGQNVYNSLFAQLQRRMSRGLSAQFAYTYSKSIQSNGMDFSNQFDFSNTHAPSLLDQRHRLSLAAVYRPDVEALTQSQIARTVLSHFKLSTVMDFSSGRPFAGLLSPACTSSIDSLSQCDGANENLNDTAFNQDTANSAAGINGGGPTPGIGLNSFYGPWLERIDVGLARSFTIREGQELQLQAQAFNLFNHANYYVQNGDGINSLQYNPVGSTCGDGVSLNQTCYLVPNAGPGNFGSLQEISPDGLPRVLQFSARYTF